MRFLFFIFILVSFGFTVNSFASAKANFELSLDNATITTNADEQTTSSAIGRGRLTVLPASIVLAFGRNDFDSRPVVRYKGSKSKKRLGLSRGKTTKKRKNNPRYKPMGKKQAYRKFMRRHAKASRRNCREIKTVQKLARKYSIPTKFAIAVARVESSCRSRARGPSGEKGIFQIHPRTGRSMGCFKKPNSCGAKHLARAYRSARGNIKCAAAKHNAGLGIKCGRIFNWEYVYKVLARHR